MKYSLLTHVSFDSRRWNKIVRNMLHSQVFTIKKGHDQNQGSSITQPTCTELTTKKKTIVTSTTTVKTVVTKRLTRSKAAAAATKSQPVEEDSNMEEEKAKLVTTLPSDHVNEHTAQKRAKKNKQKVSTFWSTREGRGLLSFIISGIFHEMLIMSACRKITLENFAFFLIQGFAVMAEVTVRQGALKQEPKGLSRIICIALQLFFMSLTGRLFTGPFLRYGFFQDL